MYVPCVLHGKVDGTKEVHGPAIGIEYLSGSPSTVIIWRRSLCCRRGWWAGDAGGGVWSRVTPFEVGGEE